MEALEQRYMLAADAIDEPSSWVMATAPPPNPALLAATAGSIHAAAVPFEASKTFLLHSNPGSEKIIFLDFDGHSTMGTLWNDDPDDEEDLVIPNIVTPPYSVDADGQFTNAELQMIHSIWERVSEDFLPFDVDVTTEDPGTEAIAANGIRVLIGGSTNDWFTPERGGAVGGVALLNTFAGGMDVGTFVFSGDAAGDVKFTAEATSHEVGHTLGLRHDGQVIPQLDYYPGHGPGIGFPTGWAPIMGVGYGQELTQWSKGEYPNSVTTGSDPAENEDDLEIIAGMGGLLTYRADDHGNDPASATELTYTSSSFSGEGIIEQNTDLDWFSFTLGIEEVTLDIDPFHNGPNLDILATLYDSNREVVATSNPIDDLNANFVINSGDTGLQLAPGVYYLSIDGTGKPFTTDPGYSDYGSLGAYTITGARKTLLEELVGVDFDLPKVLGGQTPRNWTLYSGGTGPAVLSDLINESGDVTPVNLSVHSSTGSISSFSNSIIDTTIPFHPESLVNLDGHLRGTAGTWTFTWSDLEPLTVYEVYVFGLDGMAAGNSIQIAGDGPPIVFDQTLTDNSLMVNSEAGESDRQLFEYAKIVSASATGTITITATLDEGAPAFGLGGLAIRPGTIGELSGQKWNDLNGDGIKDADEEGLPGWTIFLDQNGNGRLDPSFQQTVHSEDVPQEILDYTAVKSELYFEGVRSIFDVNITLDISHTFAGDVNAYLISPAGTRVELFSDVGGFEDNFTNTTFDDEAQTSITDATAPFTGTFRPEGSLSLFDGEDGQGIWTLEIMDDAGSDTGVLNSWSITLQGSEPSTVTDSNGNYVFEDLAPGVYRVAEVMQAGWEQTLAPPPVTVSSGAKVRNIDFGNWIPVVEVETGSISGQKWNDENGDGIKDAGEPGLPGWTIYVDGNNNGVLDGAAEVTVSSTDVPLEITDFSSVTSQVSFQGLTAVVDVNVTLDITHSFAADLDVYLISPSGRQVELFSGVGGQFNNFENTTLDDQADVSILDASAPFTGTFRPEGLLSDFINDDPNGVWKLLIRDTAGADTGTLNSWSLTIAGSELSTVTDSEGNYEFKDLVAGSYNVREVEKWGWTQTAAPGTPIVLAENQQFVDADFGNTRRLAGDYDGDEALSAADYLSWRRSLGTNVTPFSGADGDGDGVVTDADYDVWMSNFGKYTDDHSNSSIAATPIDAQQPFAGRIEISGDVDWLSFSVEAGSMYSIGLSTTQLGNAVLQVIDRDGQAVLVDGSDIGTGSSEVAVTDWTALTSGVYFLKIFDAGHGVGDYSGSIQVAIPGTGSMVFAASESASASVASLNSLTAAVSSDVVADATVASMAARKADTAVGSAASSSTLEAAASRRSVAFRPAQRSLNGPHRHDAALTAWLDSLAVDHAVKFADDSSAMGIVKEPSHDFGSVDSVFEMFGTGALAEACAV